MTTPKDAPGKAAARARVRRKPLVRTGADRSGASVRAAAQAKSQAGAAEPIAPAMPLRNPEEWKIDEAVAASVKTAYDVLAESIEQGRRSAESFRHGGYNIRDVPVDVRHMAANLLRLARQLSESTFEICEALLSQQVPGFQSPPPGQQGVPPFRPTVEKDLAGFTSGAGQSAAKEPSGMRLTVQFVGAPGAVAHSASLSRPHAPTAARDITVAPLQSRDGKAAIKVVTFDADLAGGGLVATVTVPAGLPAGVYSGAVHVSGQAVPLGMLVVELPQAGQKQGG